MQNFGKIKTVFNNLLIEGIIKKDEKSKKLFAKYLKTIKESNILKTQFLVYHNIENRIDGDAWSANLFVSENIKLIQDFKPSDIQKENEKLINILGEKIEDIDGYELATLHESISNLGSTKKTAKNIDKLSNEFKNVVNYVTSNKPKEIHEVIDLPVSLIANLAVSKFNERYSALDESDKVVLKVLIGSNFEAKKIFYSDTIKECTELVEVLLKDADSDSKERLSKVKSKLLEEKQEITEDDFLVKISRLIELRDNLKNS